MSLQSRVLAVGAMAFLAVPLAVAQYGGAAVSALNSDNAVVVHGEPCAFVVKKQTTTPKPDGTSATRITEERMWRDSQGRFRREVAQIQDGQDPIFNVAVVIDPEKNTITTLKMDEKTASVVHLPPGTLHGYVELDDKPMYAMPGVQIKIDKLSGKEIAGVAAVGRRVTRTRPPGTIGNDKTIVSVSERWISPELKIVLATSMDDPREQSRTDVTRLTRTEPDAALFQVPVDFAVTEAEGKPLRQVMIQGH
jgi:hypothetical protein